MVKCGCNGLSLGQIFQGYSCTYGNTYTEGTVYKSQFP